MRVVKIFLIKIKLKKKNEDNKFKTYYDKFKVKLKK